MVDSVGRQDYISDLERTILDAQRTHLARLTELEETFGFNIDVATDVFGLDLLRAGDTRVGRLEKLLESLAGEARLLFIASVNKKLAPGCYGFGQPENYIPVVDGVLFADSSSVAINYVEGNTELSTQSAITLTGTGWELRDHDSHRPPHQDTEPSMITIDIARHNTKNLLFDYRSPLLDAVIPSDDVSTIYKRLHDMLVAQGTKPQRSRVGEWLLWNCR